MASYPVDDPRNETNINHVLWESRRTVCRGRICASPPTGTDLNTRDKECTPTNFDLTIPVVRSAGTEPGLLSGSDRFRLNHLTIELTIELIRALKKWLDHKRHFLLHLLFWGLLFCRLMYLCYCISCAHLQTAKKLKGCLLVTQPKLTVSSDVLCGHCTIYLLFTIPNGPRCVIASPHRSTQLEGYRWGVTHAWTVWK